MLAYFRRATHHVSGSSQRKLYRDLHKAQQSKSRSDQLRMACEERKEIRNNEIILVKKDIVSWIASNCDFDDLRDPKSLFNAYRKSLAGRDAALLRRAFYIRGFLGNEVEIFAYFVERWFNRYDHHSASQSKLEEDFIGDQADYLARGCLKDMRHDFLAGPFASLVRGFFVAKLQEQARMNRG